MEFGLNMIVCVIAYWKILKVLRRQGNVMPTGTQKRNTAAATEEAVSGPSKPTTEMINKSSTSGTTGRDKRVNEGKPKAGTSSQSQGGQSSSTGLSKAKISVIRTMILILVCFAVCIFPLEFYFLYNTLAVFMSNFCLYHLDPYFF